MINEKKILVYIDDLIIPAVNVEMAMQYLEETFQVAGNADECRFLMTEVDYLGYVIGNGYIKPSVDKTKAVHDFPEPKNIKKVQSFLGLTGYFKKFIPGYSLIARPLSNLLSHSVDFRFGDVEKEAFTKLKVALCSDPVLRLYNPNAETQLHTDASILGYGAILLQRDNVDRAFHPVYYASGKTTPAEEKYTSYELEGLAIIRALKKFRIYLLGVSFTIVTDCQAFAMTMRKKDLCVRIARYALLLEEFQYNIIHRSGKNMPHVDALSRSPLHECLMINLKDEGIVARIAKAQREDPDIKEMIDKAEVKLNEDFIIRSEILFKFQQGDLVIVVPKRMQIEIIRQIHNDDHFGVNKTEEMVRKEYWFVNIRQKVERVIRNCVECILVTKKTGKQEGLLHPISKGDIPLDTYHIDHLGPLQTTKKNYKYIFYVIDSFSKFSWLYATKTCNAIEVVNKLSKQATIFGNPRRIISDRGSAFVSNEFVEYCTRENIEHILITTGVPRANGQVERANRTIISLITKLSIQNPAEWYKHVETAQLYANAIPCRSTKKSPFEIMFGLRMKKKTDRDIISMIENEWITMFDENRDELRMQAKKELLKTQRANTLYFDGKRKPATKYEVNDLVAVKKTAKKPGQKFLGSYLGPYKVIRVLRNDRYVVNKIGEHEGPRSTTTMAEYMKPWVSNDNEIDEDQDDLSEDR